MNSSIPKPLTGLHILLVEDEYLIAADMEISLSGLGADIIGPVPSVASAFALIAEVHRIDAAVLDINLGEERSYPIAQALTERDVPVIFVTGYDALAVPDNFAAIPRLNKPFNPAALISSLLAALPAQPEQDV